VAAHAPQHVNKCGEKCTDCKRPHTKIPGKKYKSAGGRVCGQCYHKNKENEEQPPQSASTPPSTPLREVRQPCVPLPPLLSPEQTQQLSSITKAAGFGQQGRSLSAPERASVILQVNALQQLAATPSCARVLSFDKLVKAVAKGAGSSSATVREVTKKYHRTGEITPEPKKRTSRGCSRSSWCGRA
jgi:hypothetical protein